MPATAEINTGKPQSLRINKNPTLLLCKTLQQSMKRASLCISCIASLPWPDTIVAGRIQGKERRRNAFTLETLPPQAPRPCTCSRTPLWASLAHTPCSALTIHHTASFLLLTQWLTPCWQQGAALNPVNYTSCEVQGVIPTVALGGAFHVGLAA